MKYLGYYNGEYGELESMKIPMCDRVCFFGDGVYDATYSRKYNIFALDEHINRFFNSAKALDINLDFDKNYLANLLKDLVKKCDDGNLFVYWQATRGTQIRNHAYGENIKANLWVVLKPCDIVDMSKKINVVTQKDTRFLHCNIKTLNLIPTVMASKRATREGVYETVFHRDGRVTECAHSNVHILKDGRLITPPADNLILAGVARAHLMAMCEQLKIGVEIRPFSVWEMMNADEIIVTSAGSLCLQVGEIDGVKVGGGAEDLIKKLQSALLDEFITATDGNND
ncbi:MAG: aminotransferase class IV [Clostridia bacterium]|nr:aminotransferase class IV [Clostridia bacterium]